MSEILHIPLHDFHAEQGARFVNFGGWNMPVQYTSILEEHKAGGAPRPACSTSATLGEFLVTGVGCRAVSRQTTGQFDRESTRWQSRLLADVRQRWRRG